jgi:c-di-GMP-binding flagellar brake protein YcgR
MPLPGKLRPLVGRVREWVGDRRGSQRCKACLPFRVSSDPAGGTGWSAAGHTHDISATGLGMLLPEPGAEQHPAGGAVLLTLRIGRREMRLVATLSRIAPAPAAGGEKSGARLLGARIDMMDEQDRLLLENYIKARRFPARDVAPFL